MMQWLQVLLEYKYLLMAVSAGVFLGGLAAMRFAVIAMPADYFVSKEAHFNGWFNRYPAARWTLLVLKNLLGYFCLAVGLMMLLTPGPGIMMLLAGLSLINFPGKRRWQGWLVRRPTIRKQVDAIRQQHGKPPMQFPE